MRSFNILSIILILIVYAFRNHVINKFYNIYITNTHMLKFIKPTNFFSIYFHFKNKKINHKLYYCLFCVSMIQIIKTIFYEKFQSILFLSKFFSKLFFDFIVTLFMILNKNNAFLIVTNCFIKYIKIIFEKEFFN